ncbi:hypothetical protein EW145_g5547 [Phellinidium pouzarii]|uniref:Uncharacterized protein n=1 Tax=Phellinidium pouzarii TaxID=167371 RepID=A0A4S4KZU4_9AGAM|nr:hypothetical protein EW145_g5547 [Phellinidium pouzarii]
MPSSHVIKEKLLLHIRHQNDVSFAISKLWHAASPDTKRYFEEKAKQEREKRELLEIEADDDFIPNAVVLARSSAQASQQVERDFAAGQCVTPMLTHTSLSPESSAADLSTPSIIPDLLPEKYSACPHAKPCAAALSTLPPDFSIDETGTDAVLDYVNIYTSSRPS